MEAFELFFNEEILHYWRETLARTFLYVFPGLVFAAIFGSTGLLASVLRGGRGSHVLFVGLTIFICAFVAYLAGFSSGNARESAMGDVIPILLGGLAGLYMLSKTDETITRSFAGSIIFVFATTFFIGTAFGADNRYRFENGPVFLKVNTGNSSITTSEELR